MTARIFDSAYWLVLFLNLTALFRFIATQVGTDIGAISACLLVLNVAYLIYRWPVVQRFLRKWDILYWIIFLFVWPLFTVLYTPFPSLREISLQFYYVSLILGGSVYVYVKGWEAFHTLIGFSLAVSIVGVVMSLAMPSYFEATALLAQELKLEESRAFGFFLQPNRAGASLIFMILVWHAGVKEKSLFGTIARVLLMIAVVGATGSRGSLMTALITGALMVWGELKYSRYQGRLRFSRGLRLAAVGLLSALMLFVILGALQTVGNQLSSDATFGILGKRLEFYTEVSSVSEVTGESSVAARLFYQSQYLNLIVEQPIGGYGLGAAEYYKNLGQFYNSSHNVFVESALEFGVIYSLVLVWLWYRLYRHPVRPIVENHFHTQLVLLLIAAMFLIGMVSNTLLHERTLFPILGALLAGLAFPSTSLNAESKTPRRHEDDIVYLSNAKG